MSLYLRKRALRFLFGPSDLELETTWRVLQQSGLTEAAMKERLREYFKLRLDDRYAGVFVPVHQSRKLDQYSEDVVDYVVDRFSRFSYSAESIDDEK